VTLQPFPISGTTKIEPTILSPTGADLSKLDADAVRATQRLITRGFEAYLVGGCVRDLLLGRTPKDYDIATEARPPQVKRTFPRNCRIIGRRFKLAHLHFHNNTKILECSTFRRTPQLENSDEDLLITRDNEFGTAEEDALRRDFTVNALFLDPTRNCILDYTDGLTDLHNRVIRTIGDPRVRFREDPVRILRAAKFAGRLGFSIEPQTFAAMAEAAGEIVRAAPPRLLEEILRLLRGGHALDSFQLLRDVGALRWLVPVLADFLQAARHDQRVEFWRLLEALDQRVLAGRVPPAPVLLGALLVCPVSAMTELNPGRSASSIAEELLGPLSSTLRLPRRDAGCLKRICGVQHRFTQTDENKRFRTAGFVQGPYFDEAFELFELRMFALGQDADAVERWREIASGIGRHAPVDEHAPFDDDARSEHADAKPTIEGDGEDADAAAGEADSSDPIPSEMPPPTNGDSGDGPMRRRRRRRRRGRRGRGGGPEEGRQEAHRQETHPEATGRPENQRPEDRWQDDRVPGEEPPRDESAPFVQSDEAEMPGTRRADFVPPEGPSADDAEVPASADLEEPPGPGDTAAAPGAAGVDAEAHPGRRRRRRRRGRGRGRGGHHDGQDGSRFPLGEQPAPHGEAADRDHGHHEPPHDPAIHLDPQATESPAEGQPVADPGPEPADVAQGDAANPFEPSPGDATQVRDGHHRRRRRRRGRGRNREGRGDGQQQPPQYPPQHRDGGNRDQHRDPQVRGPQHGERRHDRRDQRRRGHGSPRDVDVVPRYRDRRGKVEVIEPAALDLSAFDVELDPKRVPTFGSIVEGKDRPKKRPPRLPDTTDDYKPPPPPGSDKGPASPPPPPSDSPDTFGDW